MRHPYTGHCEAARLALCGLGGCPAAQRCLDHDIRRPVSRRARQLLHFPVLLVLRQNPAAPILWGLDLRLRARRHDNQCGGAYGASSIGSLTLRLSTRSPASPARAPLRPTAELVQVSRRFLVCQRLSRRGGKADLLCTQPPPPPYFIPRKRLPLLPASMHEKALQPPRRAPSPTGSEQTGDETLAEGGRGRLVTIDKPRPDGKVELTEQAAYEHLGFMFSSTRKRVFIALLIRWRTKADRARYPVAGGRSSASSSSSRFVARSSPFSHSHCH